jgi:hypothetical protein
MFLRSSDSSDATKRSGQTQALWHTARYRRWLLWRYRVWHPGHAAVLFRRRRAKVADDAVHLQAAAEWLGRAQDASGDGGVVGRYTLRRGWTSSYPETTGYIVPTFLALGATLDPGYIDRARRSVEFLLRLQLEEGGFPGNEIAINSTRPSAFNTGQIINGLLAWHQHTGDPTALSAARRAADWLLSIQDADGAWRQWCYWKTAGCYTAHLACWLADLGVYCDDERYRTGALRHLDWVLSHREPTTGWIDHCGFNAEEHNLRLADLHTISYTLAGMLHTAVLLHRPDAIDAVRAAAGQVAGVMARLGWLPGALDWQWHQRADSASLTGNVQMALIWMRLRQETGDDAWLTPAYRAIDLVKRTQLLESPNAGLRGAIAGADPFWGRYNAASMLSWATKFFIDALMMKAEIKETPCLPSLVGIDSRV